jgi:MYXO-CTERM domain-containing protein
MKVSPSALAGAALVVLLTAGNARADLIPWSYAWSNTPSNIYADGHVPGDSAGFITLTDSSLQSVVGDSYIVATDLTAHSTAPDSKPDNFTNSGYTLRLTLVDGQYGDQGTLDFSGQLNGTLTANSSNITNKFLGQTTQTVVLGATQFTVTVGFYNPPGPTGAQNSGSISAQATVPGPGGLPLAALGAAGLGLAAWRRRRASAPRVA